MHMRKQRWQVIKEKLSPRLGRIRLLCGTGKGAAKVSSRTPRRPDARRAFADPIGSLFQFAESPLQKSETRSILLAIDLQEG
jgi:hypothetical protein